MQRINTKSINFQCEIRIPWCMVLVFSENADDKEAKSIYSLLLDKGILCDYVNDYFSYKNESGDSKKLEYAIHGILLYMSLAEESILYSLDEANEWIESLPYGRIIVDGKDYTSAAELYSAINDLSVEMEEAQSFIPHQKEKETKEKVNELSTISKKIGDLYKTLVIPEETQNDDEYKPLSSVYIINDNVANYIPPTVPEFVLHNENEERTAVETDENELPF